PVSHPCPRAKTVGFIKDRKLESTRGEESHQGHLVERHLVGDAHTPAGPKWEIGRSRGNRGASFYKAFRKEAVRFWKIPGIVMQQLRAYPHGTIARKFKPANFESDLHLPVENGSGWMYAHALLQRGEAVRS